MNHKTLSTKILLGAICIILFATITNASILATASTDKTTLSTDEVGLLTIKIFNDSDTEAKEIILRAQADEAIRFIDGEEKTLFITSITSLPAGSGNEIRLNIKSVSSLNKSANIYIYYGTEEPLRYASVTMVETEELPISVKSGIEKKSLNGKETVAVSFKFVNNSKDAIHNVGAEVISPSGFETVTAPLFTEILAPNATIEKKFEVMAPLETTGEQKIVLAYGYFDDSNTPHYFEKEYKVTFQKPNYTIIILAGIIVLIIAAYMYVNKDKKKEVKGSAEKK